MLLSCTSSTREIPQLMFEQMVKDREVKQVIIVNDDVAEISLTPEALVSKKYRYLSQGEKSAEGKPQFQLRIISEQVFRDDLAKLNPSFPIISEKR